MSTVSRLKTETFLRNVEIHEELGSTNDRAIELSHADVAPELPLLIWARRQTAGRGRGANRWWAMDGALTFTVMLDANQLDLPRERWSLMSLAVGLAVSAAIQDLIPHAEIGVKWPNDVYLFGRKVCGILVEVPSIQAGRIIVGIGINVNNSASLADRDLQQKATALCDISVREWKLELVLLQVLKQLELHLQRLVHQDPTLPEAWDQQCFLRSKVVTHVIGDRKVKGICQGVGPDGALLLLTDAGLVRLFGGVIESWE